MKLAKGFTEEKVVKAVNDTLKAQDVAIGAYERKEQLYDEIEVRAGNYDSQRTVEIGGRNILVNLGRGADPKAKTFQLWTAVAKKNIDWEINGRKGSTPAGTPALRLY